MDSFKKKITFNIVELIITFICAITLLLPIASCNPSGKPVTVNFISIFTYGDFFKGAIWVTPITVIFVLILIPIMILDGIISILLNKKRHVPFKQTESLQPLIAFSCIIVGILCFFIKAKYNEIDCKTCYGAFLMGILLIAYGVILEVDECQPISDKSKKLTLEKDFEKLSERPVYKNKEKA